MKEILEKIEDATKSLLHIERTGHLISALSALHEIKQLIQAEDKPRFVEGMLVENYPKQYAILSTMECNLGGDKYPKPLDWKTLARTIAYYIMAVYTNITINKAVLIADHYHFGYNDIMIKNEFGNVMYFPYPNPTGTRQEIKIERGK